MGGIAVDVNQEQVEDPVPDPSFLRLLDDYSEAAKGRPGQYRPVWNRIHKLWMIEELRPDGRWWQILLVYELGDRETPRKFRPLDRRVIEDLVESDLWQRFGRYDQVLHKDLYRKEREAFRKAAEEQLRSNRVKDALAILNDNGRTIAHRAVHAVDYGHDHGAKGYWSVPSNIDTLKKLTGPA